VIVPAVPVVTVGVVLAALTVKEAVAPVLLSVIVSVQAFEPVVRVAVADVLDGTVAVPKLSPEQVPLPVLTLNRLLVVKFPAEISAAQT
jgi:hypothetical protein